MVDIAGSEINHSPSRDKAPDQTPPPDKTYVYDFPEGAMTGYIQGHHDGKLTTTLAGRVRLCCRYGSLEVDPASNDTLKKLQEKAPEVHDFILKTWQQYWGKECATDARNRFTIAIPVRADLQYFLRGSALDSAGKAVDAQGPIPLKLLSRPNTLDPVGGKDLEGTKDKPREVIVFAEDEGWTLAAAHDEKVKVKNISKIYEKYPKMITDDKPPFSTIAENDLAKWRPIR